MCLPVTRFINNPKHGNSLSLEASALPSAHPEACGLSPTYSQSQPCIGLALCQGFLPCQEVKSNTSHLPFQGAQPKYLQVHVLAQNPTCLGFLSAPLILKMGIGPLESNPLAGTLARLNQHGPVERSCEPCVQATHRISNFLIATLKKVKTKQKQKQPKNVKLI